jgi:hypothetical protein
MQTSRSKWQPYNISVPLDLKVTKDTRLIYIKHMPSQAILSENKEADLVVIRK